jgi:hypothetical protein
LLFSSGPFCSWFYTRISALKRSFKAVKVSIAVSNQRLGGADELDTSRAVLRGDALDADGAIIAAICRDRRLKSARFDRYEQKQMRWRNQPIGLINAQFAHHAALTANQWSLTVPTKLDDDRDACGIGRGVLTRRGNGARVVIAPGRGSANGVVPCHNMLAVDRDGGRLV